MLLGSAKFLVVDRPMVSDAILVLGGGPELRTAKAVQLLRAGYGKRILIDSEDTTPYLGITEADRLRAFVETVFPQAAAQIQVCPTRGDSTQSEMADVFACLQRLQIRKVLVVTSDYHIRRALWTLNRYLPQYHWSIAAVHDKEVFDIEWLKEPQWAVTNLTELQKLLWWEVVVRLARRWPKWKLERKTLIASGVFICLAALVWFATTSGAYIVLHRPAAADAILVLTDDDPNDLNYWKALSLLRAGTAHQVLVDVDNTVSPFGSTEIPIAHRFIAATAGDLFSKIRICSEPKLDEASYIDRCLKEYGIRSVLIVASEPHSREAFLRFRYCLSQYRWSVFAVEHPSLYGRHWWRHRQWAKFYLYSWERILDFAFQSIRSSPASSVCS